MSHLKYILLFSLLSFFACQPPAGESDQTGPMRVVATTGMVADLVQNIGGDSIEVQALMGPGVDPHLYKATQGDLAKLQKADIIFYNGLHLEGKMGEVLEKLGQIKRVVPVAENIPQSALLEDPVYQGTADPHIWFDVSIWAQCIDAVQAALTEQDSDRADFYIANAKRYRQELTNLHDWVNQEVAKIPAEKRILITAHDAFNYFGRAYRMEVRGLQGISTLSEFGLRDRVDLVNFIVEKEIRSVFVETSVSEKNINSIVEGCRQKGHEVRIGGNLYSDAMGPAGSPEGTYIGMVKANVKTMVEGLSESAENI
ncbi:MAG TPA: zinc ABC transporter substrate-binding protein [Saprospiraceae bacterium]|nr:zinc ABC transporter substrate-binding protein [Saprospiraceae bacterium]